MSSSYLQRQMTLGRLTSRVEAGSDEDEGRHRVTIRFTGGGWQAVFDQGGRLVSERRL